eukprot:3717302-Prymnesium_polylepis.1
MSRHDCAGSPGYNPAMLSPERLEKMKVLAHKASTTFPPKLPPGPYTGSMELSALGVRCLERGRWANQHRKPAPQDSGRTGRLPPGNPTKQEWEK